MKNLEFDKRNVLAGEGKDEAVVFKRLIDHMSIGDIQVVSYGGKNNLGNFIGLLPKSPGFLDNVEALGITRDGDSNPSGAVQSIQHHLGSVNFPVPAGHDSVSDGSPCRTGAFVLPKGTTQNGALESLCMDALKGDPIDGCVQEYLDCVKNVKGLDSPGKSWVYSWIAVSDEPSAKLGLVAKKGLIPFGDPAFDGLKSFIRKLRV